MSARKTVITLLSVALSVELISLTGCATEEKEAVKRTEQTADSLGEVRNDVLAAKKQLDATTSALDKLVGQATGNRRPAFENYMKERARLQVQAEKARARADDLYARADAYITKWAEDASKVQNPELKKEAEARRAKVKEGIAGIQAAARSTRDAYRPLLQDLTDIQTALSNDLTDAGIAAVKPLAAKAAADAGKLQNRAEALVAELNKVRSEVSSKG